MPKNAPYGTWSSPIGAADVAMSDGGPQWLDVLDGVPCWAEARPAEGGRVALVRATAGEPEELLPAPWNARNRVHEYGGKPWTVADESLVFTHWDNQRVHARDLHSGRVTAITREPEEPQGIRYADLRPGLEGEIWAVRETSVGARPTDVRRDLVALSLHGRPPRSLAATHHFLSGPHLAPDGRHAAWLGWDHPAMPWDGTELCVAQVRPDGSLGPHRVLAGGPSVAVCQFEWESSGSVLALLDPEGWWNLHRVTLDGSSANLAPAARELGGALWKIGSRWFAPLGGGRHAVLSSGHLAVLDEADGTVREITDHTGTAALTWAPSLAAHGEGIVGIASGPWHEGVVVCADPDAGTVRALTPRADDSAFAVIPNRDYLPLPQEHVFHTDDGEAIPAYVYEPTNPEYTGLNGELPPYLVHVHGGPTGRNYPVLDLDFAYFTSRGIGVVAVNYGGSIGYGRRYRERLREQWGVVDVADCATVARALVDRGVADGMRLAIRGGSAGGFTAAASITTLSDYRAATVKFPILDLHAWTGQGGETHDFESRYLDGLIGALPQAQARYQERSPINRASTLAGPVLFLQGLDDKICPPEQADRFVHSLRGSGIPHAYLTFAGEQHGFRKADTIRAALEAELSFYAQVFGFDVDADTALHLRT